MKITIEIDESKDGTSALDQLLLMKQRAEFLQTISCSLEFQQFVDAMGWGDLMPE